MAARPEDLDRIFAGGLSCFFVSRFLRWGIALDDAPFEMPLGKVIEGAPKGELNLGQIVQALRDLGPRAASAHGYAAAPTARDPAGAHGMRESLLQIALAVEVRGVLVGALPDLRRSTFC